VAVVLTPSFVDESVTELLAAKIHPHFAGYLCLLRTAARERTTADLPGEFTDFFDTFLRVPNGSDELPYLRPFWHQGSDVKAWTNKNVAGTYAPASIRPGMPFSEVVEVKGAGRAATYSLREGHAALALEHLAFDQPVPAVPLAAFLYRDYAFDLAGEPSVAGVVKVFRYEFGLEDPEGQVSDDFATLFVDESGAGSTADLFEENI
jgi:hypothetical protein